MAGVQHNAHVIAARFARRAELVKSATHDAVTVQAQLVARELRRRVAKFRSEAANSIAVEELGPTEQQVIVGSDHAWYIEKGVKPGGKGLPRFFDPQSADIVAWLQTQLRAGGRTPAKGSKRFQSAELELRDRYEGLAWSIRHYGVKAQPFVEPTVQEMAGPVAVALRKAVMAALTAGNVGALQ
jgi:hypothetical protein